MPPRKSTKKAIKRTMKAAKTTAKKASKKPAKKVGKRTTQQTASGDTTNVINSAYNPSPVEIRMQALNLATAIYERGTARSETVLQSAQQFETFILSGAVPSSSSSATTMAPVTNATGSPTGEERDVEIG